MPKRVIPTRGSRPGRRRRVLLSSLLGATLLAGLPASTGAAEPPVWPALTCIAPTDAVGIDGVLVNAGSPLVGEGATFVSEGVEAQIDPRLLVAIAVHETRLSTYGPADAIHNPFGLGPHIEFDSEASAIDAAARTLYGFAVLEGHATIEAISDRWAPVGAVNDPDGLNEHWVAGVGAGYRALGGDPSRSILLAEQDASPDCGGSHDAPVALENSQTIPLPGAAAPWIAVAVMLLTLGYLGRSRRFPLLTPGPSGPANRRERLAAYRRDELQAVPSSWLTERAEMAELDTTEPLSWPPAAREDTTIHAGDEPEIAPERAPTDLVVDLVEPEAEVIAEPVIALAPAPEEEMGTGAGAEMRPEAAIEPEAEAVDSPDPAIASVDSFDVVPEPFADSETGIDAIAAPEPAPVESHGLFQVVLEPFTDFEPGAGAEQVVVAEPVAVEPEAVAASPSVTLTPELVAMVEAMVHSAVAAATAEGPEIGLAPDPTTGIEDESGAALEAEPVFEVQGGDEDEPVYAVEMEPEAVEDIEVRAFEREPIDEPETTPESEQIPVVEPIAEIEAAAPQSDPELDEQAEIVADLVPTLLNGLLPLERICDHSGVTPRMLALMRILADTPLSVGEQAVRLGAPRQVVANLSARLETLGLAEREASGSGRRRIRLALTEAGYALCAEAGAEPEPADVAAILATLTAAERAGLLAGLKALSEV